MAFFRSVFAALIPIFIGASSFASNAIPSAEDLFLRGTFQAKKNPLLVWRENPYGKELDLSERRPVVNLKGTIFERKYGKAGFQLIANLYHKEKFFIARVPERGVKNVYMQVWYFAPKIMSSYLAAHTLLRFEMEKPVELVAEMPNEDQLKALGQMSDREAVRSLPAALSGRTLKNVAISAEAQWTKDDPKKEYSLVRGKTGAFTQIARFVSMEERLVKYYKGVDPVNQVKFGKEAGNLDRVLATGLRMSQDDGLSKRYDTLYYNCTTFAFDILERSLGLSDQRFGFIRSFAQKRIPVLAPSKLEAYGGLEVGTLDSDSGVESERAAAIRRVGSLNMRK